MIVTNQATDTKRNFNATSTRNRIMASTMSVDEYFDELISQWNSRIYRNATSLPDIDKMSGICPLPSVSCHHEKEENNNVN